MTPGEFRLRIAYAKSGRARWLSHLETIRAIERSIRRAQLPYAVTQGFNPHMKNAFGPALPVGTASDREYLDVWLTRYTAVRELERTLREAIPSELGLVGMGYVSDSLPSLAAALTIGVYSVHLEGVEEEAVRTALVSAVGRGSVQIEHKGKTKVYDLTRSLPKEPVVSGHAGGVVVDLVVRTSPEGSLRPDVFVKTALGFEGIEPETVLTTRGDQLIESEDGAWSRPL